MIANITYSFPKSHSFTDNESNQVLFTIDSITDNNRLKCTLNVIGKNPVNESGTYSIEEIVSLSNQIEQDTKELGIEVTWGEIMHVTWKE